MIACRHCNIYPRHINSKKYFGWRFKKCPQFCKSFGQIMYVVRDSITNSYYYYYYSFMSSQKAFINSIIVAWYVPRTLYARIPILRMMIGPTTFMGEIHISVWKSLIIHNSFIEYKYLHSYRNISSGYSHDRKLWSLHHYFHFSQKRKILGHFSQKNEKKIPLKKIGQDCILLNQYCWKFQNIYNKCGISQIAENVQKQYSLTFWMHCINT